jgi:HK97 family phage portal protein
VENLSAVLGAVELICGALASLPASITVDTPDGRVPAPMTAPTWRLLARPNRRQSWPAFVSTVVSAILLQGNSVSALQTDGRGAVTSLTPVPWPWLNPMVISGGAGSPSLVFDVLNATPEAQLLGLPRRLLEGDVLFIRARSDAGIIGRSVLSRAPQVLAAAMGVAEFSTALWQNGAFPSEMISLPPGISAEAVQRMRASFEARQTGGHNAGKILYADADAKFTQMSISPGDAETLASRRFSVADIARLFSIPEPMLQTGATAPATLTPYLVAFCQLALAPLVAVIEAEFDAAVLPAGMHLAIDMGGVLRGDYASVAASQAVLVQSRIATPNDARRTLGLPAHDDGDELGSSAAPNYPADAPGVPSLAPKPGPGGVLPNVGTHEGDGSADD